jgi:hypothetical protein
MKKSTRALVGLVILELFLIGGTTWMAIQTLSGEWRTSKPDEAISLITTTGGLAMALVGVILLLAFFHHRRNGN